MAAGPKLTAITAGSALIADTVMQNFQALADFLRAIPANSLLSYKWTWTGSAMYTAGLPGAAATVFSGYHRINFGAAPEQLEITAAMQSALQLVLGETITVQWQKCTPINGSFPRTADVWTTLGATITYTNANTVVGVDDIVDDTRFCQRAVLGPAPALADGDWVRCRAITVGAALTCTELTSDITLKCPLRS